MPAPDAITTLEENLRLLEDAENAMRARLKIADDAAWRRFYRLLILECAERLSPLDFALSVGVARQQMRVKS